MMTNNIRPYGIFVFAEAGNGDLTLSECAC